MAPPPGGHAHSTSGIRAGAVVPDRHRQQWPDLTRQAEADTMLLKFWSEIAVQKITIASCDRYHDWRKARVKRGTSHRTTDLELNTLNNAMLGACRCELIRHNPLASRRPR